MSVRVKVRAAIIALVVLASFTVLAAAALAEDSLPTSPAEWHRAISDARDVQKLLAWAVVALVGGMVAIVGVFGRIVLKGLSELISALREVSAAMSWCRKHSGMEDAAV